MCPKYQRITNTLSFNELILIFSRQSKEKHKLRIIAFDLTHKMLQDEPNMHLKREYSLLLLNLSSMILVLFVNIHDCDTKIKDVLQFSRSGPVRTEKIATFIPK